ncbi:phosphoglycerate dehydrogenase [Lacticaseibacillus porcinae]|uniref:phosphoglycerate dehydrogenase n=1 Tax=Lacticaseibacillus porcinae TaxID=1123687 RepID=UPI000F797ED6|nr:phosphoglycerate dehydrogenase [Lacticaseibacillus porcinae]
MKKVLLPKIADDLTDHYLAKHGYAVVTCDNPGVDEIMQLAPDAAGIMMISKPIPNTLYAQLPNLEILARRGVGFDAIDVDYAAKQGVWVTNAPGANARTVAELALMDMLMLARQFHAVDLKTRVNDWTGAYQGLLGHELFGATVGIVGVGHVGQTLAEMCHALGMQVLLYDRHPRADQTAGEYVQWDDLFKRSDYVSLHLASVPETKHCVSTREFELMKPTASLINLARGAVVDTEALVEALQTQQIAQAALDVFEQEPLSADHVLFQMPNVILTPHIGANTIEANRKMALIAAKQIDLVLSGRQPEYPVNQPQ